METAMPGSSSWMPHAPQGVKESDDMVMIMMMIEMKFFSRFMFSSG